MESLGLHNIRGRERERERERERDRESKTTLLKNNAQSILYSLHRVCSMNTFIQVLLGLIEVLTVLQCSLKSSYTNSQIYPLRNVFPTASRFLHRTGLPTHRSAHRFTCSASPIGPNRSGPGLLQPIWPMLSLSLNNPDPSFQEVVRC